MSRMIFILCVVSILFMAACAGTSETTEEPDEQGATTQQTGSSQTGTSQHSEVESTYGTTSQHESGVDVSKRAQDLLRDGDLEGAISILEDYSSTEPEMGDLTNLLIEAHLKYAKYIEAQSGIEPSILNEVLFSHYMRVMQLEPGNEEAHAGMNPVGLWFINRGLPAPGEVNPLAFITTEQTEGIEDEPEVTTDDAEEVTEDTEESDPE